MQLTRAACLTVALAPAAAASGEWPMWGRSPDRNMITADRVPTHWDVASGANVAWSARLGSQSYGNPVVAGGRVFVGTNNDAAYDAGDTADRGVLLAFDASDGRFLWQAATPKLASGEVNDWPYVGQCSSPAVVGERLYYLTNRAEVVALDVAGFRDGENDGPFLDEARTGVIHADVVWRYDLIGELGVFPHNMAASSPVVHDGLLFVGTSNGHDESHARVPAPGAPALVALSLETGRLVWRDDSVGERVLHGQWSSPTLLLRDGAAQVVMGQGDGWVRAFDAVSGAPLWQYDANAAEAAWPRDRNNVIATPVVHDGRVFVATGQDPEHGDGPGSLHAIDPTRRGDVSASARLWRYDAIGRSLSTVVVADGVVYAADLAGFLHAVDADSGAPLFVHDTFAAIWGSPILAGGHLYLGDEDGDVVVLATGREERVVAEINMGAAIHSTPAVGYGTLYVATRDRLYAIRE